MSTLSSFVAPLPSMQVIQVSGEQAHEYLHGQLTVATKTFDENSAKLAAHCDFKGKMFSVLLVSRHQGSFLLCTHKQAAEASLTQLKKYAVFSKVDININEQLFAFGISGNDNKDAVKNLFPELSNTHLSTSSNEYGHIICFNDNSQRYLCWLTPEGKKRFNEILISEPSDSESLWERLEIAAGIANVQADTIGEFVPQMLNLQSIDAIDFGKGCYMGQEVVARTKFLGKNKRATFILRGTCQSMPKQATCGNNIEIQIGDNWRRGGVLARITKVGNEVLALAVMSNDTELGSVVRLKDSELSLVVEPLPYEQIS